MLIESAVLGALAGGFGLQYLHGRRRFGKLDRRLSDVVQQLRQQERLSARLLKLSERLQSELERRDALMRDLVVDTHTGFEYLRAIDHITDQFPVFYAGVALDGFTARAVFERIEVFQPKTILELGSGSSTVMITALLERLNMTDTRHIAVDHDAHYLEVTRKRLERHGFSRAPELWHCPLTEASGDAPPWFGGLVERLAETRLDLVIVDGPPGAFHPRARHPAFPLLRPLLSDSAAVILDDTNREEEQRIVKDWLASAPEMKASYGRRGKGFSILYRRSEDVES